MIKSEAFDLGPPAGAGGGGRWGGVGWGCGVMFGVLVGGWGGVVVWH